MVVVVVLIFIFLVVVITHLEAVRDTETAVMVKTYPNANEVIALFLAANKRKEIG